MKLVRWEPFRNLENLHEGITRLFEDTLQGRQYDGDFFSGIWIPAIDMYETENDIVIKAELPGITKEDIDIEVKDGILSLKGERKRDKEVKEENYHRVERYYGAFHRRFALPSHVDSDKVKAKFKDGLLEITLPKAEAAKPKKIEVESAK
jgi:HSP20 family protein